MVALHRHAHPMQDLDQSPGRHILQMLFNQLSDIVLKRRTVQLVDLRQQTLLRRARTTTGRIQLLNFLEDGNDRLLAFAGDHHDVGNRSDEEAVIIQLADQNLGQRQQLVGNVRRRQLGRQVLLQRFFLCLGIEETLTTLLRICLLYTSPSPRD